MRKRIDDYRNFPGAHCGSVAMRGLLHHYCGLELPEAAVFGLGAGVMSAYLQTPGLDPPGILFGRALTMEQDLARHLQVDYREAPEPDDDEAWRVVREAVLEGRPTMLSGDIFFLDYREFKVRFPGHRFVLVGFDDERAEAYIADRIREEPETCSLGAVAKSRNPGDALSTWNLWGRFEDTAVGATLEGAIDASITAACAAMLEPPEMEHATLGVAGTRAFADDLVGWRALDDAGWRASYNASCIEKFGNGGGNFRRLYAGFLEWARERAPKRVPAEAPALCLEAADAWTQTSAALFVASEAASEAAPDSARDAAPWETARRHALRAAELEETLFTRLAESG